MMHLSDNFNPALVNWVILPILIFSARILDVSMGTLRVILVAKGVRLLASVLGFFEVLIWLVAIGQIMQNLTHWLNYIAYAAGFATGNFVGMVIEDRLALGSVLLRLITSREADTLVEELRARNYGVTSTDARGRYGPVKVIFMVLARHNLQNVLKTVERYNPRAFYTIEDVRKVHEGIPPLRRKRIGDIRIRFRNLFSKRK